MNKLLSFLLSSLFAQAVVAAEPILDVPKIAGKSKAAVAAVLGAPASCQFGKYGEKCTYEKRQTEVLFIGGKADWITVHAVAGRPYGPSSMELLGFKLTKPDVSNDLVMRWSHIKGFLEIDFFQHPPGKINYAYIKVKTP